jgi:MFS family permease
MAFVLGPPLAALLLVTLSWHWIFLINLPIAGAVLILGARVLPTLRNAGELPPLDGLGIVVTFVLLGAVVLAITRVADEFVHALLWPWALALTAVLVAVLIAVERRAARALIPLSLFANRQLAIVYGLALGAGFGMGSVIFVASIATVGYGVTPNRVGFVLLPLVVASMLGSTGAGRLLNRIGARGLLLIGFALLCAGYAAVSVTDYGLPAFLAATDTGGFRYRRGRRRRAALDRDRRGAREHAHLGAGTDQHLQRDRNAARGGRSQRDRRFQGRRHRGLRHRLSLGRPRS